MTIPLLGVRERLGRRRFNQAGAGGKGGREVAENA